MRWTGVALLAIGVATSTVTDAKGLFQAEGSISELRRSGSEITFRFVGRISFGYATAPSADPRRQWKDVEFDGTHVSVHIDEWTKPHSPTERADPSVADRIYENLSKLTRSARSIRFSLDNPTLSFSNRGELMRVSGSFIYARDLDETHATRAPNNPLERTGSDKVPEANPHQSAAQRER